MVDEQGRHSLTRVHQLIELSHDLSAPRLHENSAPCSVPTPVSCCSVLELRIRLHCNRYSTVRCTLAFLWPRHCKSKLQSTQQQPAQ